MKTILIIIIILQLIFIFHQKNLNRKMKEKSNFMQIAYDDYSAYIKAYVKFYRWLLLCLRESKKSDYLFAKKITDKYKEIFKHCQPD